MMDAATYGGARAAATAVSSRVKTEARNGLFACFMNALRKSRIQQARRVLEHYEHLLATNESIKVRR